MLATGGTEMSQVTNLQARAGLKEDSQSEDKFNCTDGMGTKQRCEGLCEPFACSGLASCTFLDVYVHSSLNPALY